MVKQRGLDWLKKFTLSVIVGFAVISFWRGIWRLMDEYIFPSSILASGVVSIVIGLLILIFTHSTIKELM
jgi:hypothetical protein